MSLFLHLMLYGAALEKKGMAEIQASALCFHSEALLNSLQQFFTTSILSTTRFSGLDDSIDFKPFTSDHIITFLFVA